MNQNRGDIITAMQSIHTKCAQVRMDLSDNVETLKSAIPAVTNEPSEGTRQQLEPTFHMVKDNLLDMQSIIDFWSPYHSFYHEFAHVVVPMVINDLETLYTSPLTVEGMQYLIRSLEALTECYDDCCCYIFFSPFPIPSVWEWSAADVVKTSLPISEFAPIYIYLVISLLLSLISIGVSFAFTSKGSAYPDKLSAHECGFDPLDDARSRFDIRFYPVSLLFIIFDSEVTFLFPWAVSSNKMGWFGFWSMMVFAWILTIGFPHEWKKGALDWE